MDTDDNLLNKSHTDSETTCANASIWCGLHAQIGQSNRGGPILKSCSRRINIIISQNQPTEQLLFLFGL